MVLNFTHAYGNSKAATERAQVLFKRKPFALLPSPDNIPDNADVLVMRGTNEVFTEYDKYLKRLDYLRQKKFVDAVNGRSGLTFFDALESETKSSTAIETMFPEVLRDPILRKVQFSTISRIDDLVNAVFDEFKRDFFPGEDVIVLLDEGGEQVYGIIREKAKFPMIRGPEGQVQRAAFSRYFVRLHHTREDECLVDDKHIRRDRKVFTKQNLRAFLKHSLQREAWIGAPWLVKEPLAIQYRLPMEIPAHLLQDAKLLANKVRTPGPPRARLRTAMMGLANCVQQQMLQMKQPNRRRTKNFSGDEERRQMAEAMARQPQQHPGALQPGHHHLPLAAQPPRFPPPPVFKYPTEDMEVPPKYNGTVRPELSFFTPEMAEHVKVARKLAFNDIAMDSMGLMLEVWNTLNVQCEVYVLDSFTFDDFVDAMRYQYSDVRCELLDEVHCAVLKLLVDGKGNLTVSKNSLPDVVAESEDESSEEPPDGSEKSTPLPDAPARSTRSRLSHVDVTTAHPRSPTTPAERLHRAPEMLGDRDWVTRLGARDFQDGGWQVILVGLLHQLSLSPVWKTRCDTVLAWLAPIDLEPTRQTAFERHATMDINLRISALQIITMLSIATPAVKDFLEACSDDMTDVRKRKIEHQKQRRLAADELAIKDRERKILLPDNMLPDSPKQESVAPVSTNGDAEDSLETNGVGSSDADDDAPTTGRSLRRGNDRKRKRDEKAAREAEEKRKAELAKQQPKQSKEFKKLLTDIEELKKQIESLEEKISECDADLREANVQRTKVLGKDRFCNRYYWYERNGQPFGGLPRSSTASYGYANGRIWVQGPDPLEQGFIDLSPADQRDYERRFKTTTHNRRDAESGSTCLLSSNEWGFYDDPVLLDHLIGWLDDRGDREKKLRKELMEWRDTIVQYMEAHKKFKDEEAAKKIEADVEHETRIATRHKTQEEQTAAKERCLKWTNSMAYDELGHIHSNPEKPKPKQKVTLRQAPPKGLAVPVNRLGKPVTRQGDKYNFK